MEMFSLSLALLSASARKTIALAGLLAALALAPAAGAATATTTDLTLTSAGSAVSSVEAHSMITLTAAVKAGALPLMRGAVKFCDATAAYCQDIHLLATAQITSKGTAVYRFYPGAGTHRYQAVFAGTAGSLPSSSAVMPLMVSAMVLHPTTTKASSTGSSGSYTLSAAVIGNGSVAAPTGDVFFLDRSNSKAELGRARLPVGIPAVSFQAKSPAFFLHQNAESVLAIADFNNDGRADLATFTGTLPTVLLGDGEGGFREVPSAPAGTRQFYSLYAADFNGDGNVDLVANYQSLAFATVTRLFLGDGAGGFGGAIDIPEASNCCAVVAVGDFDGDGSQDLLLYLYTQGLQLLTGDGDGGFIAGWQSSGPGHWDGLENGVAVGDFNGDGRLDFAWTYFEAHPPDNGALDIRSLAVCLNQGGGVFLEADSPLATATLYAHLAVADFNGDGRQDILAIDGSDAMATMLFGNSDGSFTQKVLGGFDEFSDSVSVADLNQDGKPDVILNIFDVPSEERVLLGNGDGTFTRSGSMHPPGSFYFSPASSLSADFNGDGIADVAVLDSGEYLVLLTTQARTATVTVNSQSPVGPGVHEVVARYQGDEEFAASASAPLSLIAPGGAPAATLSTSLLQFSTEQPLTLPSPAQTVLLTNTGNAALSLGSVRVVPDDGPGASFATSNNCPATLTAGAGCAIRVRFVTHSDGPKVSRLVITDNAGNSPQSVTLSGKSAGSPEVALSTASLVFAQRITYTRSEPQTITVTNSGNAVLHFNSIALSPGSAAINFRSSDDCRRALGAGASCTIRVRFTPYGRDPVLLNSGYVILTDDAGSGQQYIAIQGVSTSE